MVVSSATIDSLLKEREQYPPSAPFRKSAHLKHDTFRQDAAKDPGAFWSRMAKELDWIAPWSKVLEWNPPFAKWFLDGKLNVSANCLDRHLAGPRRNKAALVWEGEPGERRVLT
ncbi:MAG: acetyl-coenzyme A synthetase, partial [Methanobacteriota archaeon]